MKRVSRHIPDELYNLRDYKFIDILFFGEMCTFINGICFTEIFFP